MKLSILVAIFAGLCVLLASCALLDQATGANDGLPADDLPANVKLVQEQVKNAGDRWVPGAGTLLAALLGVSVVVYRRARKRQKAKEALDPEAA